MSSPAVAGGSNGYAKYQIRSSGIPRVLAQETEVFSLEDSEEREIEGRCVPAAPSEKARLFDCPLDSDEEEKEEAKAQNNRANNAGSSKERSRLTDSFDLDCDSLSDELDQLDLLPPMAGTSSGLGWASRFHSINCCNPRIPNKCSIM